MGVSYRGALRPLILKLTRVSACFNYSASSTKTPCKKLCEDESLTPGGSDGGSGFVKKKCGGIILGYTNNTVWGTHDYITSA